jgi:hypothetical protein
VRIHRLIAVVLALEAVYEAVEIICIVPKLKSLQCPGGGIVIPCRSQMRMKLAMSRGGPPGGHVVASVHSVPASWKNRSNPPGV